MDEKQINDERKKIHDEIKRKVFEIEQENFRQKSLSSTQMIQKIKKIVESEVK